jgi:hypothetical protein
METTMKGYALALGLAALAGCNSAEIGPAVPSGEGKTAILLTDAPFPFDRIARVDVHVKEIALSVSADTSERASDWVVVAAPDRTFNLLDLQNGSTALLGEAVVPPGQYRAVRLVFDPSRSTLTGADGDLIATASGPGAPGINWQAKGDRPSLFALVEEALAIGENGEDIVVDFDVGRSFLYDGSAEFTFIPHLRAIVRASSGAVTGRLLRVAEDIPVARAVVSVHIAPDSGAQVGPLLATTRSAADGRFTASFLRPGRYQVIAEDLERDLTSGTAVVVVTAGSSVSAGDLRF